MSGAVRTTPIASTRYDDFLRERLREQTEPVQRYRLDDQQVWIKRAGAPHARWPFWLLGLLARAVRLPLLAPVPNPGGRASVDTEARRLRDLALRGLRVPPVLAQQPDGFLMGHLGTAGQPTPSLAEEMNENVRDGRPEAVLPLFRQGLDAIARVHRAGTCLSQAFARNLVRCPDGVVGYVDFEDDPQAALPLAQCQARDILCYAHSAAVYLLEAGALDAARAPWTAWLAQQPPSVQALVAQAIRRMGWLRRLPTDRRWGRDLQRARAAWSLLAEGLPRENP